jgi:hypothetical protein
VVEEVTDPLAADAAAGRGGDVVATGEWTTVIAAAAAPAEHVPGTWLCQAFAAVEAEHLDWVQAYCRQQPPIRSGRPATRKQRRAWQRQRRQLVQRLRRRAAAFDRHTRQRGGTRRQAAERLGINPRTLRRWEQLDRTQQVTLVPPGRPAQEAERPQRQEVVHFLKDADLRLGLPTLRSHFPDLSRAELEELLRRSRRVHRLRHPELLHVLRWQVPGRVWAMDFAEPSRLGGDAVLPPIDGNYPLLLAVRDLASAYNLCWRPVGAATAAVTQQVLAELFALHGKPLVLKMDNGPAFRALRTWLEQSGVFCLYSPAYWPRYNGAIEATIGSLKRRTEQQAVADGRGGQWTCQDTTAALQQSNIQAPPKAVRAPTPAESWACRTAVSPVERARFELAVERERYGVRVEQGMEEGQGEDHWQVSGVDRKALERALVGHDYLLFRRRRIPQRITGAKVTRMG